MMRAFGQLGTSMEKWKKDKLYNQIMDELEPGVKHSGGVEEYKSFREDQKYELDKKVAEANLERAKRDPYSDLTAWQQIQDTRAKDKAKIEEEERARKYGAGRGMAEVEEELALELAKQGSSLPDWEKLMLNKPSHRRVNDENQGDPEGAYFEGKAGDTTIRMENEKAERLGKQFRALQSYKDAQAAMGRQGASTATPTTDPLAPVTGAAKTLDRATAEAILREAGGDRAKARALARQRGYSL